MRVGKRSRTFVVMVGTDRKRISLGKYPAISLQATRQRARDIILGFVPIQNPLEAPIPKVAVALFLDQTALETKSRTTHDYRRVLTRHFSLSSSLVSNPMAVATAPTLESCNE